MNYNFLKYSLFDQDEIPVETQTRWIRMTEACLHNAENFIQIKMLLSLNRNGISDESDKSAAGYRLRVDSLVKIELGNYVKYDLVNKKEVWAEMLANDFELLNLQTMVESNRKILSQVSGKILAEIWPAVSDYINFENKFVPVDDPSRLQVREYRRQFLRAKDICTKIENFFLSSNNN